MDLPKVRGRLLTMPEGVVLVARCPFCNGEHRYNKSAASCEEPVDDIVARGFTDEWLPCQYDLPGNYWRIFVGRSRRRRKPATAAPANGNAQGKQPPAAQRR